MPVQVPQLGCQPERELFHSLKPPAKKRKEHSCSHEQFHLEPTGKNHKYSYANGRYSKTGTRIDRWGGSGKPYLSAQRQRGGTKSRPCNLRQDRFLAHEFGYVSKCQGWVGPAKTAGCPVGSPNSPKKVHKKQKTADCVTHTT